MGERALKAKQAGLARVGQEVFDRSPAKRHAATGPAVSKGLALRGQAARVGLGLHSAQALMLAIEIEQRADACRLILVDSQGAPGGVAAQRHETAHPEPLLCARR